MTRHLHSLPDPDPFTPEDGYSPDQFVTPACDQKGHSERVRINFQPDVLPTLGQIVGSGQFEAYRSVQDVVRDAVYHRIWYLADQLGTTYRDRKLEGQIRQVVTSAARVAELEQLAYQRTKRVEFVRALEAEIEECRRLRDKAGVQLALAHAQARLDEPWLTEPYRSQVEAIVDKAGREQW